MTQRSKNKVGRPPDGIKRRNMTISLPIVISDRLKTYTSETGESASNLIARLTAEFFRTDGQPPGNIRATLKRKLRHLEDN